MIGLSSKVTRILSSFKSNWMIRELRFHRYNVLTGVDDPTFRVQIIETIKQNDNMHFGDEEEILCDPVSTKPASQ
jgi:hypothetical protein